MLKTVLALTALLITAIFTFANGAPAQAVVTPFEYLKVTPFTVPMPTSSNHISMHEGYQACLAAATEWRCREFRPASTSDSALRTVLATLGNEGWELVSAVKEDGPTSALTYLFKRQTRNMP